MAKKLDLNKPVSVSYTHLIQTLGEEGIRQIWHDANLRGRGYSRVREIVGYAKTSVGMKDGAEASAMAVKWFVKEIRELDEKLQRLDLTSEIFVTVEI